MKEIQFIRNHSPYNAGERAGFSDAEADDLVRRGVAKHHAEAEPAGPARRRRGRQAAEEDSGELPIADTEE